MRAMMLKRMFRAFSVIGVMAVVGILLFFLWSSGAFLPGWVCWEEKAFTSGDGSYGIALGRREVNITYEGSLIWTSSQGVKVQDVLSADIDNDQDEELLLLCWKRGRYGKHRPFWVEEDEKGWSQHLFVYEYSKGEIRPKWMSSYIGEDVAAMESGGEAPHCRLFLTATDGERSCWAWGSWGFSKEDREVSFAVFGDNLIHGPVYRYGLDRGGNFDFLFQGVADIISDRDVAAIGQETPLTENPSRYSDYPRFGTPLGVGQAIVDAGFDVVACATNHALDQGIDGINTTKGFFTSHDVVCLGIQEEGQMGREPYEVLVRKGIRFAMLDYTYGTNGIRIPEGNPHMVHLLEEDKVREDIKKARAETDFVMVFVHWGTEGSDEIDSSQREWAQIFLEEKVDVVFGSHPHAIQPYEVLKGKEGHEMLVYYSIGDFVSAQPEKESVRGGMADLTVSLTPRGCQVTEYTLETLQITRNEDGRYTVAVCGKG